MAQDLDVVRHELVSRIAALDACAAHARMAELAAGVDEIRAIAFAAGLIPAVTVVHFIAAALARGARGPTLHSGFELLQDAVAVEGCDPRACDAFAAVCAIRLAA